MPRPKRIFLGTTEIVRQLHDLADGFRHLGYAADTAVNSRNPFYQDLLYDHELGGNLPFPTSIAQMGNPLIRYPRGILNRSYRLLRKTRLLHFLTAYDIYVFQFGDSLLSDNRDFPILKKMGKKIICIFQGSDIRHWSATEPFRETFGLKSYAGYRDGYPLRKVLRTLRMAERYADVNFFQPSYGELSIRPYMHLYLAVNLSLYKWRISEKNVPVVIHAPSRREIKGTTEILATFERLKSEGVAFELRLLEGLPNSEVIRQLAEADVVVDELNEAHYGMLALEAMASGCAVAGGNHPGLVPLPPHRPVLPLNPSNVYSQLRRLLTDKAFRLQLTREGRPYVEKYHSHVSVAKNILQCLAADRRPQCDYYPSFFARDYRLPQDELIEYDLKRLTAQIVQHHGLPEDIDPQVMVERGLMSRDGLEESMPIPQWPMAPTLSDQTL